MLKVQALAHARRVHHVIQPSHLRVLHLHSAQFRSAALHHLVILLSLHLVAHHLNRLLLYPAHLLLTQALAPAQVLVIRHSHLHLRAHASQAPVVQAAAALHSVLHLHRVLVIRHLVLLVLHLAQAHLARRAVLALHLLAQVVLHLAVALSHHRRVRAVIQLSLLQVQAAAQAHLAQAHLHSQALVHRSHSHPVVHHLVVHRARAIRHLALPAHHRRARFQVFLSLIHHRAPAAHRSLSALQAVLSQVAVLLHHLRSHPAAHPSHRVQVAQAVSAHRVLRSRRAQVHRARVPAAASHRRRVVLHQAASRRRAVLSQVVLHLRNLQAQVNQVLVLSHRAHLVSPAAHRVQVSRVLVLSVAHPHPSQVLHPSHLHVHRRRSHLRAPASHLRAAVSAAPALLRVHFHLVHLHFPLHRALQKVAHALPARLVRLWAGSSISPMILLAGNVASNAPGPDRPGARIRNIWRSKLIRLPHGILATGQSLVELLLAVLQAQVDLALKILSVSRWVILEVLHHLEPMNSRSRSQLVLTLIIWMKSMALPHSRSRISNSCSVLHLQVVAALQALAILPSAHAHLRAVAALSPAHHRRSPAQVLAVAHFLQAHLHSLAHHPAVHHRVLLAPAHLHSLHVHLHPVLALHLHSLAHQALSPAHRARALKPCKVYTSYRIAMFQYPLARLDLVLAFGAARIVGSLAVLQTIQMEH